MKSTLMPLLVFFAAVCSGCGGLSQEPGRATGGAPEAGSGPGGHAGSTEAGTGGTSGGAAGSNSGGANNPDCGIDFAKLDRACNSSSECALVDHQFDCCGTDLRTGIRTDSRAAFDALEQYCSAQFPKCGCATQRTTLDDGTAVNFGQSDAVVECMNGSCRSCHPDKSFPCGDSSCDAGQFCESFTGGPRGSGTTNSCQSLNNCKDCSCLSQADCTCSVESGFLHLICAGV